MSESKVRSALKKKWRFVTSYGTDPGVKRLIYRRNMNYSWTWSGHVDLLIDLKKGKVVSMQYLTIEGE